MLNNHFCVYGVISKVKIRINYGMKFKQDQNKII